MIGQIDPSKKEVTVIGGGFSGLLIAYRLSKLGFRVTLFEAAARAGGLIQSEQCELGLIEGAAHSILVTPAVHRLCAELGVKLLPVRAKARWIVRGGRLRRFPLRFHEALIAFMRAYFVLAPRHQPTSILSMQEWGERFLGKAATKYLIAPFINGIYGVEPDEIRVGAAFPSLVVPRGHSLLSFFVRKILRSKRRSAPKSQMMTPEAGMGELTRKLEEALRQSLGDRFKLSAKVERLPLEAGNLIVSVPALEASSLFRESHPELASALVKIRYTPLVMVSVFVPRERFKKTPTGVGVLLPSSEGRPLMGVLFNSSAFSARVRDEESVVSLSMIFSKALLNASDEAIENTARSELERLLGLRDGTSVSLKIYRWTRAIPVYNAEIETVWSIARESWCRASGRVLFGNYSGDVSLRGMIEAAEKMAASLQSS